MPNPYFVNSLDLIAGNKARASEVESNLSAVEAGFDGVATDFATRDAAIALKAPLASPAFTGTPTAPTAAAGTATTQLATALFVQNAIAAAAALSLPTIAGNANKFLFTDGATVSWRQAVDAAGGTVTGDLVVQGLLDYDDTVVVISTNTTAVKSRTYVLTASLTLTLPASPAMGDWVRVVNRSGTKTCVVGRNATNIMSLAQDMTLNTTKVPTFRLVYADATRGWVFA